MGVVRRELREEGVRCRRQPAGAGDIGDVGGGFAREHRIALQPGLLGALDLGIPIGALDQSDHQAPPTPPGEVREPVDQRRSEEHTSELQSLMRISYAVLCLKKKKIQTDTSEFILKLTIETRAPTAHPSYLPILNANEHT